MLVEMQGGGGDGGEWGQIRVERRERVEWRRVVFGERERVEGRRVVIGERESGGEESSIRRERVWRGE